jgi:DUF971 family protein
MFSEEIRLAKSRTSPEIRWRDDVAHHLVASLLPANCRSAFGIGEVLDRVVSSDPEAVRIIRVEPLGAYAVNLAFSKGEKRGIYLRLAAEEPW